ncbi:uncharacterized protein LOC143592215 [Bidens hawaiensis]|uniref:uncharacterized protein LOC143592215 n=1 Tax=Bidens hawaiensis TaxID=980011 RepID=UPI00404B1924
MGAEGMVLFIAIVIIIIIIILFPLATPTPPPMENQNQEETTIEQLFVDCGSAEALPDLQYNDIDQAIIDCLRDHNNNIRRPDAVPIRRKLSEEHDSSSLDKEIEPIPFIVSKAETGGSIDSTTIIMVVVSAAAITFFLATLIFCWYTKTYGGVQNDEKPLLSLSRREFLNGSSQKSSYNIQNSIKNPTIIGNQSFGTTTSDLQKTNSSLNLSVSLGIPLEPPPGILTASGIAPLKPPPGRPDLALKTPPGRTDLTVQCPPANTHSPPNRSPVAAVPVPVPPARVPSGRRPPTAKPPPSAAPPPPPPPSSGKAPPPPPPFKKGPAPPPPPSGGRPPPKPPGPGFKSARPNSSEPGEVDGDDANKAKLKPFFWDKVNMANPDQAMVWSQIRAGSFQFNEEMIENLFGYSTHTEKKKGNNNNNKKSSSLDPSSNLVQIIDPKKAQNLSILLKALNVTTNEVCDALKEGSELPVELIQTLLKMAPTGEEELKLRLYDGDMSRLGAADRFLKHLVEIPFAFRRLESLLFMCTLQEEQDVTKESFQTLEAACIQLKKSRLFLKLLEAVLKTGNRMNDGTFRGSAQAFKLDTLLKLSDVKGVDGKTTLLHFVVLEIIRAEGIRAAKTAQTKRSSSLTSDELLEESANSSQDSDEYYRNLGLQVVSSLSSELDDVKKAAILDAEGLTGTVSKFGHALIKAREFINTDLKNTGQENGDDDEDEFAVILANFAKDAEKDVMWMLEEEKKIMALVKDTADYFHGKAGKDEGLRLFVIVRDFLIILDKVCKEIKNNPLVRPIKMTIKKDTSSKTEMKEVSTAESKDGKESRMAQTTDVSEPRITQTEDVSPSKQTEKKDMSSSETTDVSEPRMKQTEDASSPRLHETDDVQHETHDNGNLQPRLEESNDVQPRTMENNDVQPRTTENNDVQPRKEENDEEVKESQHKTQETDDSQPVSQNKDVEETSGKASETEKVPFRVPHQRVIPTIAMRRVDSFSSSSSSSSEDVSSPRTHETDDVQHETRENGNLQPRTTENNDVQPRKEENDEEVKISQHKTQETDDSQPDEIDDVQLRTEENSDVQAGKEEEDDELQHKTQDADDSQPASQKKDVEETSGKASETEKVPFRVPHQRLIPAIAMRRVDSFSSSSNSSSDED